MDIFGWHDQDEHSERRVLKRLGYIAAQNRQILRLLTRAPDAVHLHHSGATMPATIDPTQTTLTYTYTETLAGVQVPNVGTPAWTLTNPDIATGTDNGDGSFTILRTTPTGGTTDIALTITLDTGAVLNASDTVTIDAQEPDTVQLVAGTPA